MAFRDLIVLIVTTVTAFMPSFDSSIVNLALPNIGASLHAQLAYLIWIPTVYLLVSAALQTTMGRLGDIRGRRNILTIGLVLFTLGSGLASLSNDIMFLILNRIVQGAGSAMMTATTVAIVVDAVPTNQRGRALGINVAATYLGLTLGPAAGGFLVQGLGWRSIFYVNLPIGIAMILLLVIYLPRDEVTRSGGNFDIPGAVALSLFLVTFLVDLSRSDLGLSSLEVSVLSVATVVLFLTFILIEGKIAKEPIVDLKLFTRNRLFAAGNASIIFNYGTSQGTLLIISLYLQLVHGYSPISAGLILLAQPVVMLLTAPVAGVLSDHIDARILSSIGMFCRSAGLFLLSFLGTSSPAQNVWIPLAIIGFGHGFFSSPNANSIMSSVPTEQRGLASGTLGTIRAASNSFGIAVMGSIVAVSMPPGAFSAATGNGGILSGSLAGVFVMGMSGAFLFAAAFSGLGIFTSLVRGKEERST